VRLAYGASEPTSPAAIDEAAELTISHLDYAPIATGYYNLCVQPEGVFSTWSVPSGICSNARAVLEGASTLSHPESLGDSLAVPPSSPSMTTAAPGNIGAPALMAKARR